METVDVVVVGGGVIGLATAYELSGEGLRTLVLDRGRTGREASWAGAGILSPGSPRELYDLPAFERLRAVSFRRFPSLAEEIREQTEIDIGFRRTGGIEIARTESDAQALASDRGLRRELGIAVEALGAEEVANRVPGLSCVVAADWLPGMCQVRNPRLLAGLAEAIRRRGASILEGEPAAVFERVDDRISIVKTASGRRVACGQVVVTAGAWTAKLLEVLTGLTLPIRPVQGQIVAFEARIGEIGPIVLEGKRYLVPRDDGLVLAGSTEEEVGFAKQVTREGVLALREFAAGLFPSLGRRAVRHAWAGLRPGCGLGRPVIGRIKGFANLWVAAGHFRQGLQCSPGTARLIADWILGRQSYAKLGDFSVEADLETHSPVFSS